MTNYGIKYVVWFDSLRGDDYYHEFDNYEEAKEDAKSKMAQGKVLIMVKEKGKEDREYPATVQYRKKFGLLKAGLKSSGVFKGVPSDKEILKGVMD